MSFSPKDVANGWKNFLSKSEVTEQMAKDRAKICATCPNLKHGTLTAFVKDDIKEIQGCYCGVCLCPTSALIRSENKKCEDNPSRW